MGKTIKIIKTTLDTGRCRVNDAADGLERLKGNAWEKSHKMQWERLKTISGNLLIQKGKKSSLK